ncbi:MAG: DUF763 domain-containing protein, partial [Candidatus Omnitrophica bacterium]|nr:DUF763 domain-containing protein [Candidatus Omnitrophota bacterium]
VRGKEKSLGLFICGGKGRTSRQTPEEITTWGEKLSLPENQVKSLVYHSRMAAKVDNSLVQDGFQIYHHTFFFCRSGSWTVVQQGMNQSSQQARRYHWFSQKLTDLVCEPHAGIISESNCHLCLNLTAKESESTRLLSTRLVQNGFLSLMKDIKILRRQAGDVSQMVAVASENAEMVALELFPVEFTDHPVTGENFLHNRYLEKILWQLCQARPDNYERLVALPGVGPKTVRALSLVSEVIYGAAPSYVDPARYSFAHGGKDGTPYPVDRLTYDRTIEFFRQVVRRMRISPWEKRSLEQKLK